MGNLLKIVKGVNSGAEIALADGAVTFGSGENCDIVLADATLAAEAFVLESAAGAVTLRTLPDGEPRILSPYVVFAVGGMEFAIGSDDGTWPELKREDVAPATEPEPVAEDPVAENPTESESAPAETPDAAATTTTETESRRGGYLWPVTAAVLAIFAFLLGLFLSRWFSGSDDLRECDGRSARGGSTASTVEEGAAKYVADSLPELVAGAGLALESADDGTRTVRGNFAHRADRLEFASAAYALDPELKLDLADDETLRAGAEELVFMLTEGKIKIESATNRTVTLVGRIKSRQALLETVSALCADVNRVKTIDDTRVVCEDGERSQSPTAFKAISDESNPFAPPARRGIVPPKCPVAGIIITPYPCLVMRDGSRLAPGATIGEWTVERITEDEVTIRNGETEFKWKP